MFLLTTILPLAEALRYEHICSVLSAAASLINAFAAEAHCRACNQTLHSVSAEKVLHEVLCCRHWSCALHTAEQGCYILCVQRSLMLGGANAW